MAPGCSLPKFNSAAIGTSRTRVQTYLYATPEIQAERSEYAPAGPERDAIAHVAEAAERDRAQTAAHDEALRAELSRLPAEPFKRGGWDRAVRGIEHYRQEHGVTDQRSALGRELKDSSQRTTRKAAEARLRQAQRRLGLQKQLAKSRERGMGIERSLGIGR